MHPQYSADVQALKDYCTTIARDAIEIPYYEELQVGPAIMSIFALFFENVDVGRRAMQHIVKNETMEYFHLAGQVAAMIGEIGIAKQMIGHYETDYDRRLISHARQILELAEWSGIEAGSIAARLSDKTTALRLIKKFEANNHFAAALHLAADINEKTTVEHLLKCIIERGLYAAAGRDSLVALCASLLKTVTYNSTLTKPWILRLAANLDDQTVEYAACVGKLAAKLGGEELASYAAYARDICITRGKRSDGYIIDAMLGKVLGVEHNVKDPEQEIDVKTLLGILAKIQPRFVLKMAKKLKAVQRTKAICTFWR